MASLFSFALLLLIAPTPTLEESLALRRIAAFWEEGEYKIARHEIELFLTDHADSSYSDELRAGLGDLLFREKLYEEALAVYAQIGRAEIAQRVFPARLRCLYELQWFATLATLCEEHLKQAPDPETTAYFLESLEQLALSNPESASKQLERARPFANTESAAFAHLLSLGGSHKEAEDLFLKLASVEGESSDEMQFLAALEQLHTDPTRAVVSLREIESRNGEYAKRLAVYLARAEHATGNSKRALELLSSSELDRSGLLLLAEVAIHLQDRVPLARALNELQTRFPEEAQLPQVALAQIHLLREMGDLEAALAAWDLLAHPSPEALLERLALDFAREDWEGCCTRSEPLLNTSAEAWRFRIAAQSHRDNPTDLLSDLERLPLSLFSPEEQANWILLRAKTLYDLNRIDETLALLEPLDHPNALLLYSLCVPEKAAALLPRALAGGADLLPKGEIHLLLYNALLQRGEAGAAAEHLFAAAELQSISPENLLWAARYYGPRDSERAKFLYDLYCIEPKLEIGALERADFLKGEEKRLWLEQIAPLPTTELLLRDEVEVRLADLMLEEGRRNEAMALYRSVVARHPPLESAPSARASVALAELLAENGSFEEALSLLKATSLQMNFANEPYHLQATVAYAHLQAQLASESERWSKKLALLELSLKHYTEPSSLIEQDYQRSRPFYPDKEPLYAAWIARIEAEIAACRTALQEQDESPKARTR